MGQLRCSYGPHFVNNTTLLAKVPSHGGALIYMKGRYSDSRELAEQPFCRWQPVERKIEALWTPRRSAAPNAQGRKRRVPARALANRTRALRLANWWLPLLTLGHSGVRK